MLGTLQVGVNDSLDLASVPQSVISLQIQLPITVFDALKGILSLVPAVEIAGQVELVGAGGPLTVDPSAVHMVDAEEICTVCKIIQRSAVGEQTALCAVITGHTQVNVTLKRHQLRVELQDPIHVVSSFVAACRRKYLTDRRIKFQRLCYIIHQKCVPANRQIRRIEMSHFVAHHI